jgi:6-pyruvoyltetrahydropterin/6-carboxytetrahydropterin synthase
MPFEVSTEVTFSAAHYIEGYQGDCSKMHGHNWRVRVGLRSAATDAVGRGGRGCPVGMTYDFRKLKALLSDVAGLVDHSVLNDLSFLEGKNPTAETLAEWFHGEIARRVAGEPVQISRVEVWESAVNCATYFGGEA